MKVLLCLFLLVFAVLTQAAEKDITPAIVNVVWKWDHPTAKGRTLKFKTDGTCQATLWNGVWKLTGPRHVEITLAGNKKFQIDFDEKLTAFTGTHYDGLPVTGKRQGDVPSSVRQ
jgi:hypothetical protein